MTGNMAGAQLLLAGARSSCLYLESRALVARAPASRADIEILAAHILEGP